MSDTIRIPFAPMPHTMLLSACRTPERPDTAALMQRIVAFVDTHMSNPLQDVLREYIRYGGGTLNVVEASHPAVAQSLNQARSLGGEADPLRLDGVKWCVIIGAQGVMVPPVMHVWFARVAACVLHEQYGEPVCDAVSLLADPRWFDTQTVMGAQGEIHLGKHLRLLASGAGTDRVRMSTLGMRDFGLPDVVLVCHADLVGAAQLLLVAVAQHVLSHAIGAMQRIEEKDASHEQVIALPNACEVTRELLDAAIGARAHGDIGATRLRLAFLPGDENTFALIEIVDPAAGAVSGETAADAQEEDSSAWLQAAINELAPEPQAPRKEHP